MYNFFANNYIAALSMFIIFTILVAGLATLLSKLAVALRDKAHLSDGVIGGILIGVITSVPELISAIISVTMYKMEPSGIFGDAIGSNVFCLFMLAVCLLICIWIFRDRHVNQINTITIGLTGLGAIFCFCAGLFAENGILGKGPSPLVWHGFNFFSILIFLTYVAAVVFMVRGTNPKPLILTNANGKVIAQPGKNKVVKDKIIGDKKQKKSIFLKLSMGVLVASLVVTAAALIVSSIVLASSCTALIEVHWHIPELFGRTILLGIATSLPELICVITLALGKEYGLLIDSMVGSAAFNMSILFFGNIAVACVWTPGTDSMYTLGFDHPALIAQLIVFCIQIICMILYFVFNSHTMKPRFTKKGMISVNAVLLSLTAISYILFIVIGALLIKKEAPSNDVTSLIPNLNYFL